MKRVLLVLLACILLFCSIALAEGITEKELRGAVAQEYADWHIWKLDQYGAGHWQDETAHHCKIGLYRELDKQLELKELYALMNPLKKGDRIPWQVSNWVKVPLNKEAAERISGLSGARIWGYGSGFVFDESIIAGCADFLLDQGIVWEWLAAYPDHLAGVAVNAQGQRSLRIADWDGSRYAQTTASPWQQLGLDVNDIHSYNNSLEISTDDIAFTLYSDSVGVWRLGAINNGHSVFLVEEQCIIDITWGQNTQNNNTRHYGMPLFPMTVKDMNIAEIPRSMEEALLQLNAQGYACTKEDDTRLYDKPDGELLAVCFARVVGQVKDVRDSWVCINIGDAEYGLTGWFRQDELAFGKDIDTVACRYPSYGSLENEREYLNRILPGLSIPLEDDTNAVWLIGQTSDDRWLVEVNEQQVLFARKDAFTNIGPTEPLE